MTLLLLHINGIVQCTPNNSTALPHSCINQWWRWSCMQEVVQVSQIVQYEWFTNLHVIRQHWVFQECVYTVVDGRPKLGYNNLYKSDLRHQAHIESAPLLHCWWYRRPAQAWTPKSWLPQNWSLQLCLKYWRNSHLYSQVGAKRTRSHLRNWHLFCF